LLRQNPSLVWFPPTTAQDQDEKIRDRIVLAASYIPVPRLGSTDDCGFAPFLDDASTSRDIAFAKISARVAGTELARRELTTGRPDAAGL
jgi:5-methyltetrahydropteroyltriglutamate--homocysteine methyltransferase